MSFFEQLMTPVIVLITNRAVRWTVGLILGLGVVLWLLTAGQMGYWVGRANVETTFRVLNEETGQPIPGAVIRVRKSFAYTSEPSDGEPQDTLISTHDDGRVEFPCGSCLSYGKSRGGSDKYHLELPDWIFRVSAKG